MGENVQQSQASGPINWQFLAALLSATFLMGASFVVGKLLLERSEPLPLAGWRFVLAAIALVPVLAWQSRYASNPWRKAITVPKADIPMVLAIGLLQTGLVMGCLFLSLDSLSPSATAIIIFTNPLWVGLMAPWVLADSFRPATLVGLAIGVCGVVLAIGVEALEGDLVGCLFALGGSVAWATSTLLQKRKITTIRPLALAQWHMLIGGILLILAGWVKGDASLGDLAGLDWALFLWLAIPSSSGAFGLWAIALAKGGAAHASSFLFLTPLFAVLVSFAVLGTVISPLQAFGGSLIFFAIWLINRAPKAS